MFKDNSRRSLKLIPERATEDRPHSVTGPQHLAEHHPCVEKENIALPRYMPQPVPTMKTASIGELRDQLPIVEKWIEEGESVEITRSGKPFARLAPVPQPTQAAAEWPDFLKRLQENFPDEKPGAGLSELVDYGRGDR